MLSCSPDAIASLSGRPETGAFPYFSNQYFQIEINVTILTPYFDTLIGSVPHNLLFSKHYFLGLQHLRLLIHYHTASTQLRLCIPFSNEMSLIDGRLCLGDSEFNCSLFCLHRVSKLQRLRACNARRAIAASFSSSDLC